MSNIPSISEIDDGIPDNRNEMFLQDKKKACEFHIEPIKECPEYILESDKDDVDDCYYETDFKYVLIEDIQVLDPYRPDKLEDNYNNLTNSQAYPSV